ncbi:MAG: clan AA aspartic protease [Chthoniobacterales bacterium]|nr:clan AA aspartic protease [Chthoniobacterales bacterium]
MIARRFLVLLPCLWAAVGLGAAAERAALPGYSSAQMSRGPENHLLLHARINGSPVTLLLDTGADVSFLRADRAQHLGVRVVDETMRTGGKAFPTGVVSDLQAGDAHFRELRFALYEASEIGGAVPGEAASAADGLIGLDMLRRYEAVINCHSRQLFFRKEGASGLDLTRGMRAMGFRKVPIIAYRHHFLTVPCHLNGRLGQMILDTGAFVTALADDAVRAFTIKTTPSRLTARGFDGKVRPVELAQVNDLRIGDVAIAPQTFAVIDLFDSRKQVRAFTGVNRIEQYSEREFSPGERIFGLLGNELLDQRRAIIDLESMSLFLK